MHLGSLAGVRVRIPDHLDQVDDLIFDLIDAFHIVQPLRDILAFLELKLSVFQSAEAASFLLLNLLEQVVGHGYQENRAKKRIKHPHIEATRIVPGEVR